MTMIASTVFRRLLPSASRSALRATTVRGASSESTVAAADTRPQTPNIAYSSFFEGAKEDRKAYVKSYDEFARVQTSLDATDDPRLGIFFDHLRKALYYNIPHGKMARSLPVSTAYKYFHKNPEEVTDEEIFQCHVIGWCFETVHSYVLLTDDIIDGSPTRRKKPCWYLKDNIGLSAINDAFSMHSGAVKVLYKYCRDKPYYVKAMELVNEHCWEVSIGQTLDVLLQVDNPSKYPRLKELHTIDNYLACVEYKTSATFWSALAMALHMHGMSDPEVHHEAKELLRTLGHLFQYQNDGVDCFGDPEKTIRVGTDVEDGKCTIFSVRALEMGDARQVKILEDHLGRKNPESAKLVKDVYYELGFPQMYVDITRKAYNDIFERLQNPNSKLPEKYFRYCIRLFFEENFSEPK